MKFLHAACDNCHGKKWLKLIKGLYSQSEEDEHDKQIVSETMYGHDDHYFKFCILRSVVLKQFRKSVGVCQTVYKYRRDVVIKLLLHCQKALNIFN